MFETGIRGKTVLVTGASSGLGKHFSDLLHSAGAHLVVASRNVEKLEKVSGAWQNCNVLELDVSDKGSVDRLFDEVGPLDILVNNAGVADTKPAIDLTLSDWDRVMDTNLKGAWLVAQKAAQNFMNSERPGVIVNIASIVGNRVARNILPYTVSKAALIQMTKALALEWARYNIRINALAPGYIETDMNKEFLNSEMGQKIRDRIPLRRIGQLDDLDAPFLLLCGDGGRFMTGSTLYVDGGHLVNSL